MISLRKEKEINLDNCEEAGLDNVEVAAFIAFLKMDYDYEVYKKIIDERAERHWNGLPKLSDYPLIKVKGKRKRKGTRKNNKRRK